MDNFDSRLGAMEDCAITPDRLKVAEKALTLALVEFSYLAHGNPSPAVRRAAEALRDAVSGAATGPIPGDVTSSRWTNLKNAIKAAKLETETAGA